jgi:dGTP triphosphohydrolase
MLGGSLLVHRAQQGRESGLFDITITIELQQTHDAAMSKSDQERNIIPFAFRDEVLEHQGDSDFVTRTVTDMIAGMTEQGLVKLYHRLRGVEMGSILDQVQGG